MYMDSRGYASVLQVAMPLQVYALGYMYIDIKVVQVATPRLHVATPYYAKIHVYRQVHASGSGLWFRRLSKASF